jgi:putative flippase GtrA
MWKTLVDFSAQISRFKHILPLSTAQINCSGSDLPLSRKPSLVRQPQPMSAVSLEALHRWKRFGVSGIANTIIGSLAIFTLQIITKNANLSNVVGYLIGSAFGYFIHAQYTFRAKPSRKSMLAYSGVVIACFALNLGVLNLFLRYTSLF